MFHTLLLLLLEGVHAGSPQGERITAGMDVQALGPACHHKELPMLMKASVKLVHIDLSL